MSMTFEETLTEMKTKSNRLADTDEGDSAKSPKLDIPDENKATAEGSDRPADQSGKLDKKDSATKVNDPVDQNAENDPDDGEDKDLTYKDDYKGMENQSSKKMRTEEEVLEGIKASIDQANEDLNFTADLGSLLEDEELSEEFQKKALTIFESAISATVKNQVDQIKEDTSELFESAVSQYKEETEESINTYLGYVVNEWKEENKLAIESGIRLENAESFMTGLKDLLAEHYVNVPEERVDLVSKVQEEKDQIETILSGKIEEIVSMKEEIDGLKKTSLVSEFVSDMVETKAEKIRELSEDLEYKSDEDFGEKLGILKENYFPSVEKKISSDTGRMITEDIEGDALNEDNNVSSTMKRYASSLSSHK